ncbi:cytochrome P450 [Amycolatopsis acidicola]|uniref:Cytochrome P450 n=1 Tax=Amycolatopsis acidicola TaxID=2596893 RepID=A0A5N0VCD4_9PSEU|nr:cytochrome P450 [Amycolatopsis acidicola]KAA9164046.1 cytochrome P450 [Amycolatopsis acidicola]
MTENHDAQPPGGVYTHFNYAAAHDDRSCNEELDSLRSSCPVGWSRHFGGHWVVTGYDQVTSAFRDWKNFSSARRDPEYSAMILAPMKAQRLDPEEMDPPEWRHYRNLVGPDLSPASARRLLPRIEYWTARYLDQVLTRGRMNVIEDFANPLPAAVALEWLGFPREEWKTIAQTYHDLLGYPVGSAEFEAAYESQQWIYRRVREEIQRRRAEPGDDVITRIAVGEIDGELIPEERAEAVLNLLVGGGVETSASLIAAGILHLGRNPDDRRRLLDEPGLLEIATEEFLRMYPPARSHSRTVATGIEFEGCPMRPGDRVLLSEAAANRDPAQFDDPLTFRIDRFPNRHLSFGSGIHRCPGSHLARLEFQVAIRQLLEKIPDYSVVEDEVVAYPNWGGFGGWQTAVIEFEPV